jgi:hypothetical protein
MQEHNPCRKLTLHEQEGTWRVGRPAVTWLDSVEEDMRTVGVGNRKRVQGPSRTAVSTEEENLDRRAQNHYAYPWNHYVWVFYEVSSRETPF